MLVCWFFVFCLSACEVEFGLTSCEVELEKAETTSTSRSSRTTRSESLALLRSSDSFLSAFSRILVVELDLAEMACVSRNIRRTLHVPSGVPVQRSISERSVSYPSCFANLPPQRLSSLSFRGCR